MVFICYHLIYYLFYRRIGPFNLGGYGILSSIINGCNLITTQLLIPKLHFYFGFQSFPNDGDWFFDLTN